MIQANELRIGNYFRFRGVARPMVLSHFCRGFRFFEIVDPIPLTEEILLKCGFDNDNGNEDWSNYDDEDEDKFVLCGNFINDGFVYTAGEGIPFAKPIKYLHQLQNLYFALCGKELEIKL